MKSIKSQIQNTYKIDIGRFRIIKMIRKDEFAFFYLVEDIQIKKKYVAKVIRCEKEISKEMINHEIETMVLIHNFTLINLIGYSLEDFEHEKNVTIIMELNDHYYSLSDCLNEYCMSLAPYNYDNTSRQIILIGIAHGMMTLHKNGILHGNLSTSNVILDSEFHPKIFNFSNQKLFNSEKTVEKVSQFQTTIYTAPETIKQNIYNEKSEVYSFGILMYEVVTDQIPFEEFQRGEMTDYQLKYKIIEEDFHPNFPNGIKDSIKELILKCLSKDPNERPTFSELFHLLAFNRKQRFIDIFDEDEVEDEENDRYFIDNVDHDVIMDYVEMITNPENVSEVMAENLKLKQQINELLDEMKQNEEMFQSMKKDIEHLKEAASKTTQIESPDNSPYEGQNPILIESYQKLKLLNEEFQNLKDEHEKDMRELKERYDQIFEQQNEQIERLKSTQKALFNSENSSNSIDENNVDEPDTEIKTKPLRYGHSSDSESSSFSEENDHNHRKSLELGFIPPFGINKYDKSSYMNSALQCFLSLSSFIRKIDSMISESIEKDLLSAFKSFIKSQNPAKIRQIISQKNTVFNDSNLIDPFEFTVSFISQITTESNKIGGKLFVGKCQTVSRCTKCFKDSIRKQEFTSISLSIQNARNIIYIPYAMKSCTLAMMRKPEVSEKVKICEATFSTFSKITINKFLLMSKVDGKYKIIDEPLPEHSNVYAFEIPEIAKNCCLAIVHLKNNSGVLMTKPFLCQVPTKFDVNEDEVKTAIINRLIGFITPNYEYNIEDAKDAMEITKPFRFPTKFRCYKNHPTFSKVYINVRVTENNVFNFASRLQKNQKEDISLKSLFLSYIRNTQLENGCKFTCEFCGKKSRVFNRMRLSKLPRILVFQVKRSSQGTGQQQDDTPVSFPHSISIDLNGEFNSIEINPSVGIKHRYVLRAVSHHSSSLFGSSFWASCRRDTEWFDINDTSITQLFDEPNDATGSSYIAFYQRVS